ncbi:MAG: hypothetical protein IJY31_01965 [Muribaculaceae bacterium]|nr:hypothetical protein [Muribaculaceae bacterium]
MKKFFLLLCLITICLGASAHQSEESKKECCSAGEKCPEEKPEKKSRLTLGGYGEAVFTRNFYSDNYMRYTDSETYKNDDSHGRFDLPHVVLYLGYDFGKGWSLGTEIEFEHGGTESAVEIEEEEAGEYESEVERGGEVALEQFWIQKSFSKALNLKMGHIIVPVGATNQYHMPTEFFTNYRPEGENTIMPCTWHETGISLWGRLKDWRYEVLFLPGLDSDRFGRQGWVHDGAGSPYEFKIANAYAGAVRIDNYSVKGLRMSVSGYIGNSFKNTLSETQNKKYEGVTGTVMIGAFDFQYNDHNLIVRGNFDYGHLSDSELITKYNMSMRKDSPSPKQAVGSDAIAAGIEAGYDIFSFWESLKSRNQKFYVFGRYEYYDSMYKTEGSIQDYAWCGRQRIAAGVNWYPMKDIVIKGEYSLGLIEKPYNNEPAVSIGVAYSGFFTK